MCLRRPGCFVVSIATRSVPTAARMGVPVLLDWDGAVSRSFHFKADVSNVLVITQAGFIVYSFAGPVTEDGVKGACAAAGKVSP